MSVKRIKIAQIQRSVYLKSVEIPANKLHVVPKPFAKQKITLVIATAHRGCREILLFNVLMLAARVTMTAEMMSDVTEAQGNALHCAREGFVPKVHTAEPAITGRNALVHHPSREMALSIALKVSKHI
jgi:hypothetical protein